MLATQVTEISVFFLDLTLDSNASAADFKGIVFLDCEAYIVKDAAYQLYREQQVKEMCANEPTTHTTTLLEECKNGIIRKVIEIEASYFNGEYDQLIFKIDNLASSTRHVGYNTFYKKTQELLTCLKSNKEDLFKSNLALLKQAALKINNK